MVTHHPDEDRAHATRKFIRRVKRWKRENTIQLRSRSVTRMGWEKHFIPHAEFTRRARQLAHFYHLPNYKRDDVRGGVRKVLEST